MVTLCQDAKAHVLHVLHLMLHVHSSSYMTCSMWSLNDTCHVMTTLGTNTVVIINFRMYTLCSD